MTTSAHLDFQTRMKLVRKWLLAVETLNELATTNIPPGRSRHLVRSRRAKEAALSLGSSLSIVPSEGAYLFVCAEFELAVRKLIEDFSSCLNAKVPRFDQLDEKLRTRHTSMSATILNELGEDRFSALGITHFDIVQNLMLCFDPATPNHNFQLNQYAMSYTRNNFNWTTLNVMFKDLGVSELNDKVADSKALRKALGSVSKNTAKGMIANEVNQIMLVRNRIVHRNAAMSTPSLIEVKRVASILEGLVWSLFKVLQGKFLSL